MVVDGEVGEEAIDLVGFEFARVLPVEPKEPIHPAEIRFLGSKGVVAYSDLVAHSVEEERGLRSRSGRACVRHGINRT